jgi:hypothetical protein
MPLDNYTDLQAEIQDWLFGRADVAAKAPTLISMFEARVNRTLFVQQMEERATATFNMSATEPQYVSQPTNYQTMRSIRITNGTLGNTPSLKFATPSQIDVFRDGCDDPAQPEFFTTVAGEFQFYPTPDQAYILEMVYRINIPALSNSNASNWLLALAPDLYLFGSLVSLEAYLMDDERVAMWKSAVDDGLKDLKTLSDEATYNAGPLIIRRTRRGY